MCTVLFIDPLGTYAPRMKTERRANIEMPEVPVEIAAANRSRCLRPLWALVPSVCWRVTRLSDVNIGGDEGGH
jgi:hypothetical protein